MNCSIVYCLMTRVSAGLGVSFFFVSGVCFVTNALFDTSGFVPPAVSVRSRWRRRWRGRQRAANSGSRIVKRFCLGSFGFRFPRRWINRTPQGHRRRVFPAAVASPIWRKMSRYFPGGIKWDMGFLAGLILLLGIAVASGQKRAPPTAPVRATPKNMATRRCCFGGPEISPPP